MASKATTGKKGKKAPAKKAAAKKGGSPKGTPVYRASKIHSPEKTISVKRLPPKFSRADLVFHGVDHSDASYEARVFINNPGANEKTPMTEENGYAGKFSIFGHGGCFGDVGHCEINMKRRDFDPRLSHPLQPIKKTLVATPAIQRAVNSGADIKLTVVPVVMSWTEKSDVKDV